MNRELHKIAFIRDNDMFKELLLVLVHFGLCQVVLVLSKQSKYQPKQILRLDLVLTMDQ